MIKKLIKHSLDLLLSPIVVLGSIVLMLIRKFSVNNFPLSKKIFLKLGVFPITDNYSEPLFNAKHLRHSIDDIRNLPGIDLNVKEQLELLNLFEYNTELLKIPLLRDSTNGFYHLNSFFGLADAEYLYNIIRFYKPNRIIEIGSGFSTLLILKALSINRTKMNKECSLICIEPYENKWLESLNINLIRNKVECLDLNLFKSLESGDILFIDSSHIIRQQGDVLFELLEILPSLKSGVLVHLHDIRTPRDYPAKWLIDEVRFYNEQYILEAFLSMNNGYTIIGALNFLKFNYFNELSAKCPIFRSFPQDNPTSDPGSFWIKRI